MTENWDSYLCDLDGKPGSVVVNLSLINAAVTLSRPLLGRVAFKIDAPDDWGFPDAEEYNRLVECEKSLVAALCERFDCLYAGRVMRAGDFDCFFYLEKNSAEAWLALARKLGGAADARVDADPAWDCYKNLLYPDDMDWLTINNRRACERLAELGHDVEQNRIIEHLADFESEAAAAAFSAAAMELDFTPAVPQLSTGSKADSDSPLYSVLFTRLDAPGKLDVITLSLAKLAKQHNGSYRGWTTALS